MNNNSFSDISGKLYYVVEAHGSLIMAKSLFKNISTTMSGTSYSVVATPGSYSNQSSIVSSLFMNNNFNNIFYTQGIYNIESCAIFNNTVSKLINNEKGATVTAENNWWGSNSSIDSSMSDVIPTNYVVMDVSYAPVDEIDTETEVTVTADFTKNDAGSTLENPIPDGVPVELTTIMGTTNPETTTTVNGIATAIYTSSTEGTETITVKQDETSATINFEVVCR